jgi:hypothetical protein
MIISNSLLYIIYYYCETYFVKASIAHYRYFVPSRHASVAAQKTKIEASS